MQVYLIEPEYQSVINCVFKCLLPENAYRFCQPNGQWIADNSTGLPIVNFTMCRKAADEMGEVDVLAGSAEEPFLLLKV